MITPIPVHHGRLFTTHPIPAYVPSPNVTVPSTPTLSRTASPIPPPPNGGLSKSDKKIYPYICWGFKINEAVMYLSDVSHIPEDSWSFLKSPTGILPVLVLDCLGLETHTSHFGLAGAIATARRVAPYRTYLTGFSHMVTHDEYVTIGEVLGGRNIVDNAQLSKREQEGLALIEKGDNVWLRPSHDGLRIYISKDGVVTDETYN